MKRRAFIDQIPAQVLAVLAGIGMFIIELLNIL